MSLDYPGDSHLHPDDDYNSRSRPESSYHRRCYFCVKCIHIPLKFKYRKKFSFQSFFSLFFFRSSLSRDWRVPRPCLVLNPLSGSTDDDAIAHAKSSNWGPLSLFHHSISKSAYTGRRNNEKPERERFYTEKKGKKI